jgi:uncharacterized protein YbjT (DUF2867 family)
MKKFLKFLGGLFGLLVLLIAGFALFAFITLRPSLPDDEFVLQPTAPAGGFHVLVFGATGKLGTEIVEDLIEKGDKVTAFVRETSDRSQLEPLGVEFVVGDVLDAESVFKAYEAGEFDAAIVTISGMQVANLDSEGNVNVADGALAAGVDRLIMVSTVGAGDSYDAAPLLSRLALSSILPQKTMAEDYIRESGLNYTIVRPGGLPPGVVPTGGGFVSENPMTMGFIKRPDLARLIVEMLYDDRSIGKTLSVVDPGLKNPMDGADPE